MRRSPNSQLSFRQARRDDLAACAEIWRAGIDDYSPRVGRLPLGPPPASFTDMMGHLLATDPATFVVAEREEFGVVGFASAIRRESVWFLSMLFVLPGDQGHGVGRALLERVLPATGADTPGAAPALSTCTDSVQPISNALYSRYGIVPRVPVLELVGRPVRAALPALPGAVATRPIARFGSTERDAALAPAVDAFDRALLGYARPVDHEWLAQSDRQGFAYVGGDGTLLGYGYVARSGRVGPIAVADEALMGPAIGHVLASHEPAGAFSAWVPGTNGAAVEALLATGLLIEDYPALLCWSRPYADFSRYLPITLAIL